MRSTFTPGVKRGMTITRAQAQALRVVATPWAWLPALMATTPWARSSAVLGQLVAGAALLERGREPGSSNLRNTCAPTICDSVRDSTQGRVQHLAAQAGGGILVFLGG